MEERERERERRRGRERGIYIVDLGFRWHGSSHCLHLILSALTYSISFPLLLSALHWFDLIWSVSLFAPYLWAWLSVVSFPHEQWELWCCEMVSFQSSPKQMKANPVIVVCDLGYTISKMFREDIGVISMARSLIGYNFIGKTSFKK